MKKNKQRTGQGNRLVQAGFIGIGLAILAGAIAVPFWSPSPSLYYKLGTDRLLLQAGKVFGLTTAVLLLFQVVFISRGAVLERGFALRKRVAFHRVTGKIILIPGLLHPFFILAAEDFTFYPLELRYWPEFTGVGLACLILAVVVISAGQKQLGIPAWVWRRLHQWMTPLVVMLAWLHIRFVSQSFASGIPMTGLWIAGGTVLFLLARIWFNRFFK